MTAFAKLFAALGCILLLVACSHIQPPDSGTKDIVTQKLVLDFRYFCRSAPKDDKPCRQAVTKLPKELGNLLARHPFGGIILFADNIETPGQSVRLVSAMQLASLRSRHKTPLLITTDQEGGIVTRLPTSWSTGFPGAMAIAAMPEEYREQMAYEAGKAMGAELRTIGVNVNHAPVLDVNSDPTNPVIHVRSFSDQPDVVATLGAAMARGFAASNVVATAKHFPGHGNTATDSHLGLPVVSSDRQTVYDNDLAPFAHLIDSHLSPMIMTAHIQFPALDSATVITRDGRRVIVPATLSRPIITDLLRGKMGFDGVVISDALNMKAISDMLDPTDAVRMTFEAGVDLALMPLAIRSPADIKALEALITDLAAQVPAHAAEWTQSVERINKLKSTLDIEAWANTPLKAKINAAKAITGSAPHKALEAAMAAKALSFVHGKESFKPINATAYKRIQIISPKADLAAALKHAIEAELDTSAPDIQAHGFADITRDLLHTITTNNDLLIIGNASPGKSLVDLGGMADLQEAHLEGSQKPTAQNALRHLIRRAKQHGVPSLYISFRFPYELSPHLNEADFRIAAYYDRLTEDDSGMLTSPTITALAKALTGTADMPGTVPIRLSPPKAHERAADNGSRKGTVSASPR